MGWLKEKRYWLERAGNQRWFDVSCVRSDHRFAKLQTDRDFPALLKRIGLE
jgi:hypothetical protein